MLFAFTLLGTAATFALFLLAQGQWLAAAALFALGTIGFNGGVVFSDALLLDVAEPRDYDRVSAFGYALGYLGGGLLFSVNVLMVTKPAWFGLSDAAAAVRLSFITVSAWWLLFTAPVMLFVREQPARGGATGGAFAAGWRELAGTLRDVARRPMLWQFLLAYWLYIDGVNTVIKMAVNYGLSLGLESRDLLGALLLTQFVGFPAALVFGRLGERVGARAGVLAGIAI
jgi:UMF1 family MFS transporter